MMQDTEPMTTLDDAEWRVYKRSCRALQHRRRLERAPELDPMAWLDAVDRDDLTDPVDRELVEVPQ